MTRKAPYLGITLVELLVTLAVIAILATIGLPALENTIRDARVTGQTNEFAGLINYGRVEATQGVAQISLRLEPVGNGWRACVFNATTCPTPANCENATQTGCVLRLADHRNVATTPDILRIDFDSRGILTTGGASVRLTHNNCTRDSQSRDIAVLMSGQATITPGQCGG